MPPLSLEKKPEPGIEGFTTGIEIYGSFEIDTRFDEGSLSKECRLREVKIYYYDELQFVIKKVLYISWNNIKSFNYTIYEHENNL